MTVRTYLHIRVTMPVCRIRLSYAVVPLKLLSLYSGLMLMQEGKEIRVEAVGSSRLMIGSEKKKIQPFMSSDFPKASELSKPAISDA